MLMRYITLREEAGAEASDGYLFLSSRAASP
jgi:hypothetical protein